MISFNGWGCRDYKNKSGIVGPFLDYLVILAYLPGGTESGAPSHHTRLPGERKWWQKNQNATSRPEFRRERKIRVAFPQDPIDMSR